MSDRPYVIVGANVTGASAARVLRQSGFEGRIVLIGAEPDRPYERPPLSKEFLRGELPDDKLFLATAEDYAAQRIELQLGHGAVRLAPADRVVHLDNGERVPYERLLIATGASPRRLDVPGATLPGVRYLRTKRDAERLRADVQPGRRAVVIGAGFIGAEVAASCRERGLDVTVLEAQPVPLRRALGDEVGELYTRFHRERGVDLRTSQGVKEVRGAGRAEAVVTTTGETIACDFVVVGVGVVPETAWLSDSGVKLDNGVVVDQRCETTVPGVFAAGDVANWPHPGLGERIRVEHFDNAQNQGIAAAKAMLGKPEPYAPVLFFWSDQYDLKLQYVGHASRWDRIVYRGDRTSHSFTAFYLLDSRVKAALGINRFKDVSSARKLIQRQVQVSEEKLRDESIDLKSMA